MGRHRFGLVVKIIIVSTYPKGRKKGFGLKKKHDLKSKESPNSYLLRILLDASPYYVSGSAIAKKLNVSRVAIWARISKLRKEGFAIEAYQNRGYRLASEPNNFNHELLIAWLMKVKENCKIYVYDAIDSTNSEAERLLVDGESGPFAVIAKQQNIGRGRIGKKWHSPPDNGNLYLSIAFRPNIDALKLRIFTLWQGICICNYLRSFTNNKEILLKWPNDIVIHGKKLGGMLTEASINCENIRYLIFGFGLNINSKISNYPLSIKKLAYSLFEIKKESYRIHEITANLIKVILSSYKECYKGINSIEFSNSWNKLDALFNKRVSLSDGNKTFKGIGKGISPTGGLIIKLNSGELKTFHSGEVLSFK